MKITEKQLHQLLYIINTYVMHQKKCDEITLKQVVNLMNQISNQQSEELKEIS